MSTYRFFPPADAAQDDIWRYSYEEWGQKQAKKYITQLHAHLQALADQELPWLRLPADLVVPSDLDLDVYFSRYERHVIFFRPLRDGAIGVLSILHAQMDIPVRLIRDLERIEES